MIQEHTQRASSKTGFNQKWFGLDAVSPGIESMCRQGELFCVRFMKRETSARTLVISGKTGIGKTKIAKGIYRWAQHASVTLWDQGHWSPEPPTATYVHWPSICDGFKDGDYNIMDEMRKADLLVIDDIGSEHDPSKNALVKLCQVLTDRDSKFTVVTTNMNPDQWDNCFDLRVADRLRRNSLIIDLRDETPYSQIQHEN